MERTPAPNLQSTRGPSLVSKARHTSPSRLARGPAPPPTAAVANTATAPPVHRSEPRFLGSQKTRAQRWPPQAPPHCAAVQARLRPARHRWRRSRQTAPPPPTASHKPRGCPRGDYGGLPGRWPPTPPGESKTSPPKNKRRARNNAPTESNSPDQKSHFLPQPQNMLPRIKNGLKQH